MQTSSVYEYLRRQMKGSRRETRPIWRALVPLLLPALVLLVWQVVVSLGVYPEFIIPSPSAVLAKFIDVLRDGRLLANTWVTLSQTLAGLTIGVALSVLLGYAIAKNRLLDDLFSPLIIALQSTPVVAYAPLLVIWFGNGPTSKVVTSALIVFFPMLMNTVVGLRSVPKSLRDLMLSLRATPWQMFKHLEVPAALPVLLGGLKVSATLAVIGSVVGEFVSARAGLGWLINDARYNYDTPLVLVAVLMLAAIARVLYAAVSMVEKRVLAWRR
ncbi:MAG: ABC transporter permease [Anaerolineae bacterium]|nr:ABC transporter permease [Anaerolineae bacterium]